MTQIVRIAICTLVFKFSVLSAVAQSVYPHMFDDRVAVPDAVPTAVTYLSPADVRLLPGRMYDNLQRDSAWLMSIGTDRLLHSFRTTAGVFAGREGGYMTVPKLGGWESLDCELRGHTTGHVLSALSLLYAYTGNDCYKTKADSIVDGLYQVQATYPDGYLAAFPQELINRNIKGQSVWAPWYTLHKIMAGLLDQYLYAGNDKALEIATRMGTWAYNKLKDLDEATRLRMIRNEFGGINEAFYNLYAVTGDEKYLSCAEFFYHPEVIDPLKQHNGDMGTRHTNTFIPKVLAEMRHYELQGDTTAYDLGKFFYDLMIDEHTFANGCLSDKEHFFAPGEMHRHLSGYTGETCCTYNMLKLARHLFSITGESDIIDYYERALYNHILGQQDPSTGMVAYFIPLATGSHRVYSTPYNSFWCCVGSGFESNGKMAEQVYAKDGGKAMYVNLFVPSQAQWRENDITITQRTDFPRINTTRMEISAVKPVKTSLKLRYPAWTSNCKVSVNGKRVNYKRDQAGYIELNRTWKQGDVVELTFDMELRLEPVHGDDSRVALFYGPILLAGGLGTEGMEAPAPVSDPSRYNDYYTYDYKIPQELTSIDLDVNALTHTGPLTWETPAGITIQPLYDTHRQRHVIYWHQK